MGGRGVLGCARPHDAAVLAKFSKRSAQRDTLVALKEQELGRISGMSQRKLQEFGRVVLAVIVGHLEMNPRQIFAATSFEEPGAASGRSRPLAAAGEGPYDKELFERLRQVRRKLAALIPDDLKKLRRFEGDRRLDGLADLGHRGAHRAPVLVPRRRIFMVMPGRLERNHALRTQRQPSGEQDQSGMESEPAHSIPPVRG